MDQRRPPADVSPVTNSPVTNGQQQPEVMVHDDDIFGLLELLERNDILGRLERLERNVELLATSMANNQSDIAKTQSTLTNHATAIANLEFDQNNVDVSRAALFTPVSDRVGRQWGTVVFCPVCLENLPDLMISCGHAICQACWSQTPQDRCPQCHQQIDSPVRRLHPG